MKIISWNVNGIRACGQKGFLNFVKKQDPDILCIQENKCHPEDADPELVKPLKRLSYWSFADKKGYSGTTTYVKKPALKVQYGIGIKKFDHEGRFVITEHKKFNLFNVYFPNGSQTEQRHLFKQEFLKRFSEYLKRLIKKGQSLIVLGDYNVAYMDIDVFDPKGLKNTSGFLPEERKWLENFLKMGFIDVYRHFYPTQKEAYTWWSYREKARENDRGWRIDHICLTQDLLKKVKSVKILKNQMGSDHCPVMMELV